jgi:regulator of protease activity HflC (stomatin/prohibitin superfamily)
MFFTLVPEKSVKLLQRLGKYHTTLGSGLRFFIPFVDQIEHNISLKEDAISINNQAAITRDNVALVIDGVVFYKVTDPVKAAYNIDNYGRGNILLMETSLFWPFLTFFSPEEPCNDVHEIGDR